MALPIKKVIAGRVSYAHTTALTADSDSDTVVADQDIQVAAARIGDVVEICESDETNAFEINAYVSANGIVTVRIVNASGSTITANISSAQLMVFHRN